LAWVKDGRCFFSSHPRVVAHWRSFAKPDEVLVRRMSRILYRGRTLDYPLRLASLVRSLPIFELLHCGASYVLQRLKRRNDEPSTFEEWVTDRFGRRLFEMFFKTYTEKVWGISCPEIDASWASQRIKSLSVRSILKNLLKIGSGPRTLLEEFIYPRYGAGAVYARMAEEFHSDHWNEIQKKKRNRKFHSIV
jgi:protoporphyrinogen oxidase